MIEKERYWWSNVRKEKDNSAAHLHTECQWMKDTVSVNIDKWTKNYKLELIGVPNVASEQ